jgi:hypothetical protein
MQTMCSFCRFCFNDSDSRRKRYVGEPNGPHSWECEDVEACCHERQPLQQEAFVLTEIEAFCARSQARLDAAETLIGAFHNAREVE